MDDSHYDQTYRRIADERDCYPEGIGPNEADYNALVPEEFEDEANDANDPGPATRWTEPAVGRGDD